MFYAGKTTDIHKESKINRKEKQSKNTIFDWALCQENNTSFSH